MVTRRIVGLVLACGFGLTAACGGGSGSGGSTSETQGTTSESTPSANGAAADDASASARCMQAFTTLQSCGTDYDMATFLADCSSTPVYESCLETTDLSDCSAIALCKFEEAQATTCGGNGGVPAGTESCSEVAACQGTCIETNGGDACTCACDAKLSPAKAVNLLINNGCALEKCPACTGGSGGDACVSCFHANCSAESSQCASN